MHDFYVRLKYPFACVGKSSHLIPSPCNRLGSYPAVLDVDGNDIQDLDQFLSTVHQTCDPSRLPNDHGIWQEVLRTRQVPIAISDLSHEMKFQIKMYRSSRKRT